MYFVREKYPESAMNSLAYPLYYAWESESLTLLREEMENEIIEEKGRVLLKINILLFDLHAISKLSFSVVRSRAMFLLFSPQDSCFMNRVSVEHISFVEAIQCYRYGQVVRATMSICRCSEFIEVSLNPVGRRVRNHL